TVTGVQTCALPISRRATTRRADEGTRREANGFGVSGRTAGGESPILGHSDAGTRSPRSEPARKSGGPRRGAGRLRGRSTRTSRRGDRKSTRLNSSHGSISYAVFCLKKKKER